MSRYLGREDFYTGNIYANSIYMFRGKQINGYPWTDTFEPVGDVPVLEDCLSGDTFFLKAVPMNNPRVKKNLASAILKPCPGFITWPVEFVFVGKDDTLSASLHHSYMKIEGKPYVYADDDWYAMLFPYDPAKNNGGYPQTVSLEEKLSQIGLHHWDYNLPEIRKIAVSLVNTLREVNRAGFLFFDFNLSRFLLDEQERVLLDFSPLISRWDHPLFDIGKQHLPPEFIEPYLYFNNKDSVIAGNELKIPDRRSQNFSLAAMLFYLMFGRLPYHGFLLIDQQINLSSSAVVREVFFYNRYLHRNNIGFIFDPAEDAPNVLRKNETDTTRRELQLWESCPEKLKELFLQVFLRENALHRKNEKIPGPQEWIECFREIGWEE